jgi:hypothetical protein
LSELSNHDQAALKNIEEQLSQDDPRLTRLLAEFGRRGLLRRIDRMWFATSVSAAALLVLVVLLIVFAR